MKRCRLFYAGSFALLSTLLHAPHTPAADIEVNSLDAPNQGFNDPSPPSEAASAGDNPGQTLGEQRRLAFLYAADLWGALLDSPVTIRVDARMSELECDEFGAVLGSASSSYLFWDPATELWYPSALADAVMGEDQYPGNPDIEADFNALLDQNCMPGSSWYYGLDGAAQPEHVDFLSTILHELAHGLGFISYVDLETGEFPDAAPDAFGAQVFDTSLGRSWAELNAAELRDSAKNVRALVWGGAQVQQVAPTVLVKGYPTLQVTPTVSGFSGAVNEANVGVAVSEATLGGSVQAPLRVINDSCELPNALQGSAALLRYSECTDLLELQRSGVAALLIDTESGSLPPGDGNLAPVAGLRLPVLMLNAADALLLRAANEQAAREVILSADAQRLIGADAQGRVLLNATDPHEEGSSIFHWDSLTRRTPELSSRYRDLLMEPAGITPGEQLDLTAAILRDMGWAAQVCGDGEQSAAERCDEGSANSDFAPDACRTNCQPAGCGDGVVDSDESCDEGAFNDAPGSVCTGLCQTATCGDGIQASNEGCDEGPANSDTLPNACRADCQPARCGDAVLDTGEECEPSPTSSNPPGTLDDAGSAPTPSPTATSGGGNSCRADCTLPRCGDARVDPGEQCDSAANSDTLEDACRTDCRSAHCGDGVIDRAETCDDGNQLAADGCSAVCRSEPAPAVSGGNGVPGSDAGAGGAPSKHDAAAPPASSTAPPTPATAAPPSTSSPEDTAAPAVDAGLPAPPDAALASPEQHSDDAGCGCSTVGDQRSGHGLGVLGLAGLTALWSLRSRARWRRALRDSSPHAAQPTQRSR